MAVTDGFGLTGRVAVVTGAAPRGEGVGNGMATAILFAREGAKVVLVNRDRARAEKLLAEVLALPDEDRRPGDGEHARAEHCVGQQTAVSRGAHAAMLADHRAASASG